MINECGHKMCENCMNTIFTRPTAPCPECGQPLKKSDYRERQFDDMYIERDVNIRKEIMRDFNKREEDFDTLEEYNDYLENVEEMIHKRVNNINILEISSEIEKYKKDNRDQIYRNRRKQEQEIRDTQDKFDRDITDAEIRRDERRLEMIREKQRAKEENERKLDELISGKKLSPQQEEEPVNRPKENEPISFAKKEEISYKLTLNKHLKEEPYVYTPMRLHLNGPTPPPIEIIDTLGYNLYFCNSIEGNRLAGGFSVNVACQRVLQEAFTDLYYNM
ncbi:hypothetical protein LOD99_12881 [Oopsacas minuta]|uniref:CDK-activating kinase assembly factor MAT1 n=1 Tax=Oopsacas minuta TaxID=111878 RepID=A0AAV7JDH0_9METZ|nr:hypothetical protein LOD99_12881 [Oopsacas minuta]